MESQKSAGDSAVKSEKYKRLLWVSCVTNTMAFFPGSRNKQVIFDS